jgi:ABC-type dipeptide/oligopeptide/nickel transport system permease component
MPRLVLTRLLQMPLILLAIYSITFSLAWLIPGNPLEKEGRAPPQEIVDAMKAQYNLDNPLAFFWDYLGKASGVSFALGSHPKPFDLGPSLSHENWSVNEILAAGLPVSITLGLAAILLACVIGLTVGVIGALKPGSARDALTLIIALVGISLPSFVVGT